MTKQTETTKKTPTIAAEVIRDGEIARGLVLQFSNGKVLQLNTEHLSPVIQSEGLWHGIKQKLVDAAAITRNTETGASATVDDKYAAVHEVFLRLTSGLWNKPAEGGGNAGGILLMALQRVTGKDKDVLKGWLDGKTTEQKNALRKDAKVAAAIAEIEAERLKANPVDASALLGELDGLQ